MDIDEIKNARKRILQLERTALAGFVRLPRNIHMWPIAIDFIKSPDEFFEIVRNNPLVLKQYDNILVNYYFSATKKSIIGGVLLYLLGAGFQKEHIEVYKTNDEKNARLENIEGVRFYRGRTHAIIQEVANRLLIQ